MTNEQSGFERIRPRRGAGGPGQPLASNRLRDPDGRQRILQASVSSAPDVSSRAASPARCLPRRPARPLPFAAVLECSSCGVRSTSTLPRALLQSVPGVHVPWLKRGHGSFMRCPACRRFTWVSMRLGF